MFIDTIAAIATPSGRGGVGIIRLSGHLAYSIALQLNNNKPLTPRRVSYHSFSNRQGELIDNGLIIYFNAPYSFTGEDVVEFHTHGSPFVLDALLEECTVFGARLARPGEFSERAFHNNKMDLAQAEAMADLISASSHTAARMAIRSLQGEFSQKINAINEKLIQLRLYVEAAIDFAEEEIDFLNDGIISAKLSHLLELLVMLRASASQGAIIREGITLVIAGRPNAGKSTLINCLAERDVAIVTDIAGTTRDVMREHILLDDIPIHLIDTAGLRESEHRVEKEGIKRAWDEVKRADCVLLVIDIHDHDILDDLAVEIEKQVAENVPIIIVYNKIDRINQIPKAEGNRIYISAKLASGIELLKEKIKKEVGFQSTEGQFLARRRHLLALDRAINFLHTGEYQLQELGAGELLAEDLRLAHLSLCEITGEFSSDDLLGRIFSNFCIGK